jgi:hypothetical protein
MLKCFILLFTLKEQSILHNLDYDNPMYSTALEEAYQT